MVASSLRIDQLRSLAVEAGRLFAETLDYEEAIERVVRLAVPACADGCFVDLLAPDGRSIERVAVGSASGGAEAVAPALKGTYSLEAAMPGGAVARAITERRAEVVSRIVPDPDGAADVADRAPRRALEAVGARSAVVAPLLVRGSTLGALTLVSSTRDMDDDDRWFAEELARTTAAALDRARLFEGQRRARERVGRLQEVTAALSRAGTAEQVADAACRIGGEATSAAASLLWMAREGDAVELVGSWNMPAELVELYAHIAADAPRMPVLEVLRTRRPLWVETADDFRRFGPEVYEYARAAGWLVAYAALPLEIGAGVSGVLVFTQALGHVFDDDERAFFTALAQHCAQALDRARLLDGELRSNQRLRLLAAAGERLSASLDMAATLGAIADLSVPEFADWCSVSLVAGAQIQRIAIANRDADQVQRARAADAAAPTFLGDGSAVARVVESGRTEWMRRVSRAALDAAAPADRRRASLAGSVTSAIVVPLAPAEGRIGAISFAMAESGRLYDKSDVRFAEELGRRAGLAVANATLFQREQRSRERIAQLQTVTSSLARAATAAEVAEVAARVPVDALGGAMGVLFEAGPTLRMLGHYGVSESWIPRLIDLPRDADAPAAQCARRREPLWIESFEELRVVAPEYAATVLRDGRERALVCVPLLLGGSLLGVLGYGYAEDHVFSRDERAFALTVADQCAQALERARLLDAARDAARRAEEANRIKDEFLATVSHELRTPLNAILGWASLLAKKNDDAAAVARGLEIIRRNAATQTKLVEDILDVSRIITGKLKIDARPVDLAAVLRDAIDVVRPSAEAKGVDLALDLGSAPECLMIADGHRLQQAIWNLLSNAVKFTEAGGRVRARISREPGAAVLTVRDTGRGIEPGFLPYVFDRFKQGDSSTTRRFGGLGLGLAIVRHIVESHGGSVSADSAGAGRGATFRLVLPVRAVAPPREERDTPTSARERRASERPASIEGVRVLVLDDHADARELLVTVLAEAGAIVRAAESAATALEAFGAFRPDVVVSDIGMPDEDGYAFIGRVRTLAPAEGGEVPAIALTAYVRPEDVERALRAGFQAHVAKPVDPRELLGVVSRIARSAGRAP